MCVVGASVCASSKALARTVVCAPSGRLMVERFDGNIVRSTSGTSFIDDHGWLLDLSIEGEELVVKKD